MLGLVLLIPLQDTRSLDAQEEYAHARQLFLHGYLEKSQRESEQGYARFSVSDPEWASKFRLLTAESMLWRGTYDDSLRVLSAQSTTPFRDQDDALRALTIQGISLTRLHQFSTANEKLSEADNICAGKTYLSCGEVSRAHGVLAFERGETDEARKFFVQSLDFAQAHRDKWLAATALLNLGAASLQQEHYDEAADWARSAYAAATKLGGEDIAQVALGNLGWDFFKLGDTERSLECLLEAEKRATRLGDVLFQIKWLTTAGYVNQEAGELARALQSYLQALELAKHIDSKEDIVNSLEDLAHISIETGKFSAARAYINQLTPRISASDNHLDALDVMLAQGKIAAAERQDPQAEKKFRAVEKDPAAQASMKLVAEHEIASLYERQGKTSAADQMYRTALATFESAREQLKNEDSKLPFLANATSLYDDYIHFLVEQGKANEALQRADQSRAQTLAQGLGVAAIHAGNTSILRPSAIAQKTGATLLFYWLGKKRSYLWAITAKQTGIFPLPPQREITQSIERYRKTLLGLGNPLENSDPDGLALYRTLVAPASGLIHPESNVVILSDGELSQLNFETLIVPTPHPHYWIEDATVVSAPSLHLLASANSVVSPGRGLLLFGDAVSPNPDYPELPMAASEMQQIQQHFRSEDESVYSRERANAESYLTGNPQQFAYIHFVAHGVASRTDPLDSAIILSRSSGAEDSFKLHARDIIEHPIHARLVTISACYGSGTRSYAGEGLVGLAWAFLRAGAHNVIGALWEVSDESTPQLMGELYQGLGGGMSPGAALRHAKLSLLHSPKKVRKPFYWAPLQMYTGL